MIIWLITCLWIVLGCAQMAHIITLFTDRSLQTYTLLSCVFILLGVLGYASIRYLPFAKKRAVAAKGRIICRKPDKAEAPYIIAFAGLAAVTLRHFIKGYVPVLEEANFDIVVGNLQSGNIMGVHPFIGGTTELAMPMRRQLIGLTSFYSGLAEVTGLPAYRVLCQVVPVVLWVLSILLYWAFAEKLFSQRYKRWLFISAVALFYLAGAGGEGLVGARLFYAGFSGEALRSTLLLPYALYVSWQKKWLLAALAVVMEVCVVWTTYGIGYCFPVVLCMFFVHLWMERRAGHAD